MVKDSGKRFKRFARAVGFADPERVRQSFIRVLGRPPSTLRRAMRETSSRRELANKVRRVRPSENISWRATERALESRRSWRFAAADEIGEREAGFSTFRTWRSP